MAEIILDDHSNNNSFSLEKRIYFYEKVFIEICERIEKDIIKLEEIEKNILKIRKDFHEDFSKLSYNKYNINIFNEFKKEINEFKIDLQISALNAKIKSLDMQEFSNIISVIGLSLQEESIKVTKRFDELKNIFKEILESFDNIADEIIAIKYINVEFSKSEKRLKKFIEKKIISFLSNYEQGVEEYQFRKKLRETFLDLISKLEERLVYIYFILNNKFSLNIRIFLKKLMICFRKIKFLLKDFLNFIFKINYLTLITKIEVGRISEEKFLMVVTTLEEITIKAAKINQKIIGIYEHYIKIYKKFNDMYSQFSINMRKKMFNEYNEVILAIKEEMEAIMKFLKNEIKKLEVLNDK